MSKVTLAKESTGLRVLTLNDPSKRNKIDDAMRAELLESITAVRHDPDATALVVTGAGTAFCAGADLPAVFGDSRRSVATLREDLYKVYESFLPLRSLSIPTIAAVQGPAVGAGLNLAMVCDIRVAGPLATFAATFSQIGLHPGGGCSWFLVQAMGEQRALKLLLGGGTVLGPDSVDAGLAVSVEEDPLAAAVQLARGYAAMDPQLAQDIKRTVRAAARDGFDAVLELEAWAQASSGTKPAIQEVVARFRK